MIDELGALFGLVAQAELQQQGVLMNESQMRLWVACHCDAPEENALRRLPRVVAGVVDDLKNAWEESLLVF